MLQLLGLGGHGKVRLWILGRNRLLLLRLVGQVKVRLWILVFRTFLSGRVGMNT